MSMYRKRQKAIAQIIARWGYAFGLPVESTTELAMDAQSMLESGQTAHRVLAKVRTVMRDWYWEQNRGYMQ
jgi:hypothetical protein